MLDELRTAGLTAAEASIKIDSSAIWAAAALNATVAYRATLNAACSVRRTCAFSATRPQQSKLHKESLCDTIIDSLEKVLPSYPSPRPARDKRRTSHKGKRRFRLIRLGLPRCNATTAWGHNPDLELR